MRIFGKFALSVIAWVVVTVIVAVPLELSTGRARPGFVPLPTLIILVPILWFIWRKSSRQKAIASTGLSAEEVALAQRDLARGDHAAVVQRITQSQEQKKAALRSAGIDIDAVIPEIGQARCDSTVRRSESLARTQPSQRVDPADAPVSTDLILREVTWLVSCVFVVIAFVLIVMATGAETHWPAVSEWALMLLAAFGLVTLVRVGVWVKSDGGRRFRYWPEVVLIAGVCLLAYGGSGVINSTRDEDSDRYLVTIGAGLAITGTMVRRHLALK